MSISEDDLRAGLRNYAEQAGLARFPTEPVIRRARRRRARFMATAGCCVVAVAAAVVAAAQASAHPAGGRGSYVPPVSRGLASNGPWPTSFGCGQALPAGLPGSTGSGVRIWVGPITRTSSGEPHVAWDMAGTGQDGSAPPFAMTQAIVLIVRDDGTIVAVLRTGPPASTMNNIELNLPRVSASEIARTQPRITTCQLSAWSQMWAHHQQYGVVVLMTEWGGYSGADPARFSAAAALPSG